MRSRKKAKLEASDDASWTLPQRTHTPTPYPKPQMDSKPPRRSERKKPKKKQKADSTTTPTPREARARETPSRDQELEDAWGFTETVQPQDVLGTPDKWTRGTQTDQQPIVNPSPHAATPNRLLKASLAPSATGHARSAAAANSAMAKPAANGMATTPSSSSVPGRLVQAPLHPSPSSVLPPSRPSPGRRHIIVNVIPASSATHEVVKKYRLALPDTKTFLHLRTEILHQLESSYGASGRISFEDQDGCEFILATPIETITDGEAVFAVCPNWGDILKGGKTAMLKQLKMEALDDRIGFDSDWEESQRTRSSTMAPSPDLGSSKPYTKRRLFPPSNTTRDVCPEPLARSRSTRHSLDIGIDPADSLEHPSNLQAETPRVARQPCAANLLPNAASIEPTGLAYPAGLHHHGSGAVNEQSPPRIHTPIRPPNELAATVVGEMGGANESAIKRETKVSQLQDGTNHSPYDTAPSAGGTAADSDIEIISERKPAALFQELSQGKKVRFHPKSIGGRGKKALAGQGEQQDGTGSPGTRPQPLRSTVSTPTQRRQMKDTARATTDPDSTRSNSRSTEKPDQTTTSQSAAATPSNKDGSATTGTRHSRGTGAGRKGRVRQAGAEQPHDVCIISSGDEDEDDELAGIGATTTRAHIPSTSDLTREPDKMNLDDSSDAAQRKHEAKHEKDSKKDQESNGHHKHHKHHTESVYSAPSGEHSASAQSSGSETPDDNLSLLATKRKASDGVRSSAAKRLRAPEGTRKIDATDGLATTEASTRGDAAGGADMPVHALNSAVRHSPELGLRSDLPPQVPAQVSYPAATINTRAFLENMFGCFDRDRQQEGARLNGLATMYNYLAKLGNHEHHRWVDFFDAKLRTYRPKPGFVSDLNQRFAAVWNNVMRLAEESEKEKAEGAHFRGGAAKPATVGAKPLGSGDSDVMNVDVDGEGEDNEEDEDYDD